MSFFGGKTIHDKNDEFEAQERVSLVGCRKICNPGIKKKKKALLPPVLEKYVIIVE
jgi:hypothetical protein